MSDEQAPKNQFAIQKLYIKDISFESPATPKVFSFQKWEPKIELNLTNKHTNIARDLYEAVLSITVTATHEDKTAFLIEIHQAGVFAVGGFNEQDRNYILGCQCMNILLPYAREVISDMTTRGGFPPLILAPVNFDALYQQHMQAQKDKKVTDTQDKAESEPEPEEPVKH